MKFLISFYHFILSSIFPVILLMLIFPTQISILLILLWSFCWFVGYLYIDKSLLYLIGAREIAASDHSSLFQYLKNRTFIKNMKTPRIYTYSGRDPYGAIVLHSRSEWTLVLEERFLQSFRSTLTEEQLIKLTDFFVAFEEKRNAWKLTKSLGITSLTIYSIFRFWRSVFFGERGYRAFKVFSLFTLSVFKPFFDAALLAYSAKTVKADKSLADIYQLSSVGRQDYNHSFFLLENLVEVSAIDELLVNYVENFSSLRLLDIADNK